MVYEAILPQTLINSQWHSLHFCFNFDQDITEGNFFENSHTVQQLQPTDSSQHFHIYTLNVPVLRVGTVLVRGHWQGQTWLKSGASRFTSGAQFAHFLK